MYKQKRYITRNAMVVEEYHSARYMPPGEKRQPKRNATPEQIRKNNQRVKERKVRLLLLENFQPGDYHTTLTYRKDQRPENLEECRKDLQRSLRKLRTWYRKQGEELKWIANIERGSKGAWHIHMVVNRITDTDIKLNEFWPFGRPKNVVIEDSEGMTRLAAYITKEPDDAEVQRITCFSRSRNLREPKTETKEYRHWKTWNKNKIRIPKGYYLGKNADGSEVKEWGDLDGYPHREYTLYKIQECPGRRRNGDTHLR